MWKGDKPGLSIYVCVFVSLCVCVITHTVTCGLGPCLHPPGRGPGRCARCPGWSGSLTGSWHGTGCSGRTAGAWEPRCRSTRTELVGTEEESKRSDEISWCMPTIWNAEACVGRKLIELPECRLPKPSWMAAFLSLLASLSSESLPSLSLESTVETERDRHNRVTLRREAERRVWSWLCEVYEPAI